MQMTLVQFLSQEDPLEKGCPFNGAMRSKQFLKYTNMLVLPWWLSDKESACQCRRHRFDPRSRKIPLALEQ